MLLWPLGGFAAVSLPSNIRREDHIFVAAMGPATHVPMAFFWLILTLAVNEGSLAVVVYSYSDLKDYAVPLLCYYGLVMNLLMFAFNLFLPAYPLDGSRITLNLIMIRWTQTGKYGATHPIDVRCYWERYRWGSPWSCVRGPSSC